MKTLYLINNLSSFWWHRHAVFVNVLVSLPHRFDRCWLIVSARPKYASLDLRACMGMPMVIDCSQATAKCIADTLFAVVYGSWASCFLQEICYRRLTYDDSVAMVQVEKGCRDVNSCTADMYGDMYEDGNGFCTGQSCIRCIDQPSTCSEPPVPGNIRNEHSVYHLGRRIKVIIIF